MKFTDVLTQVETEALEERTTRDVNHPAHYNQGKIEVADFIADQRLNFDLGNVVKYVCRRDAKSSSFNDNGVDALRDLRKAQWYLGHEISIRAAALVQIVNEKVALDEKAKIEAASNQVIEQRRKNRGRHQGSELVQDH